MPFQSLDLADDFLLSGQDCRTLPLRHSNTVFHFTVSHNNDVRAGWRGRRSRRVTLRVFVLQIRGFIFTPAQCFPPAHQLILSAVLLLLLNIFWSILRIDECILRLPLSGMISSQLRAPELPPGRKQPLVRALLQCAVLIRSLYCSPLSRRLPMRCLKFTIQRPVGSQQPVS